MIEYTWNLTHLIINGCFNWMIPILYIGKGHLTKASRYNLSLPNFLGIYRENPRKWGERSAKASRKVQVPSTRVGPFQSQPLILVYFFQLYTASNLDDFKPKGFLFKPKHILKPLSPRKLCERWCCPDTIAKAKMMVAKVSRKVLRKGYMSISRWSLGFDHRSNGLKPTTRRERERHMHIYI